MDAIHVYIILGVIAGLPLLLALIFRVNAIMFFVAVAVGALLSQYISDDASLVLNAFFSHANVETNMKLALLILPVVLSLFFLRKSLSTAQLLFHFVPLLVTSGAFATLVIASLPGGVQHDIVSNPIGKIVDSSEHVLIAASSILTLLLVWFTSGGNKSSSKHHK